MSLPRTLAFIIGHPLSRGRSLRSLMRFLRWQIGARLVPGPVACNFVNGTRLLAEPGMTGATGNIYVGLHEFEDMAFALHVLRPGDLFVDVGANIGSYVVLAAGGVGARCIAFEPGDKAYHWLLLNIRLNGISDLVDARQEALGAKAGTVLLTTGLDTVNHIVKDGAGPEGATAEVTVSTMDDALAAQSPLMLKIDVEGFETEVINGAQGILSRPNLRCVLIELNEHGARYGFDENAVRANFEQNGFEPYRYMPHQRLLVKADAGSALAPTGNTLFVRDPEFVADRLTSARSFIVLEETI